jgi:outer membrane protein assembly factor BamB
MTPRWLRIGVLALMAMGLIMAVALGLGLVLGMRPSSLELRPAWQAPASGVEALKLLATQGELKSTLFVQDRTRVALLDAESGRPLLERRIDPGARTSLGDVDGDGRNELLLYTPSSSGFSFEALRLSDGRSLIRVAEAWSGRLERAVAVRFDSSSRVSSVLRASSGELLALGPTGEKRWSADGPEGELLTLDTIGTGGQQLVLCATKSELQVFDGAGHVVWRHPSSAGVRRARSLEPTPRESVVVVGEESGSLTALSGATGSTLWSKELGQPATELRLAEVDGDPAALELVVGAKKGGLWVFSRGGAELLAVVTSAGKIAELASVLAEPSGGEVLIVGGAAGQAELVWPSGKHRALAPFGSSVERLLGGTPIATPMLFAAAGEQLTASRLLMSEAPPWYTLIAAGGLGSVVVGVVALLLARMKPAKALHLGAEQMTIEAQQARKIMLREALNELKQLGASGQLSPPDLLQRLRQLREQLADADRRLLDLGASLEPQTFICKRCGGPLEIGAERCDYCGSAQFA